MSNTLYITGAGVSADSGIPTFRGEDGFWTVGSKNYTPQQMATRQMYITKPDEFLLWYYKRFAKYRNLKPNSVHEWLSNKTLITQNIDGLDYKAGNKSFIPIHGSLNKVTIFETQECVTDLQEAPWDKVQAACKTSEDDNLLRKALLEAFKISTQTLTPQLHESLKPFVLLFDEYYTDLYRISEADKLFHSAKKFVFIGTSFNVNITEMALRAAVSRNCEIEVVDPEPVDLKISGVKYLKMTASDYIKL
jgi:NAD-dependent deacetylase